MSDNGKIGEGKQLIGDLSKILHELSDEEIGNFFKDGVMDDLLNSILDSTCIKKYPNAAEFFLANKNRSSLIADIRYAISRNYSIRGLKDGITGFVSPSNFQWFDDGVIFLEGTKPFAGLIVLYRDGNLSYAIAARDVGPGEDLVPEDFEFISMEDFRTRLSNFSPTTIASSTNIPRAKSVPKSESIFKLYPNCWALINPIIKLVGIPIATTKAIRTFIKKNRAIESKIRPNKIFETTVFSLFFIQIDVSVYVSKIISV